MQFVVCRIFQPSRGGIATPVVPPRTPPAMAAKRFPPIFYQRQTTLVRATTSEGSDIIDYTNEIAEIAKGLEEDLQVRQFAVELCNVYPSG